MAERHKYIKIPDTVEFDKDTVTDTFARFKFGPLARGWGWTMGTVLRRAMLSSVEGAAPTQLRINGVIHEFSTLEGVLEDVPLIVLNIKKLRFRLEGDGPEYARLHADNPGEYTGAQLELSPNLTLLYPETHLLSLTAQDRAVHLEIKVERGRGYESQEFVKKRSPGESQGTIFLDAFYSPVRQVKIDTTNVRYGERIDYEQVTFEVTTDGSVTPLEALSETAELLKDHVSALSCISEPKKSVPQSAESQEPAWKETTIDSLDVPQTVKKALQDRKINTLGELVRYSEEDMKGWEEIKPRSLASLLSRLKALGVELASQEDNLEDEEDET